MSEQTAVDAFACTASVAGMHCELPARHAGLHFHTDTDGNHSGWLGGGSFHSTSPEVVRQFDTGANRDTEDGKLDVEGFLSPQVLFEYARYMHSHRLLKDGTMRASDNWQKGIPQDVYVKSLLRHVLDLWLHHRGVPQERPEEGGVPSLDETLGGIVFNICGYWHEALRVQA